MLSFVAVEKIRPEILRSACASLEDDGAREQEDDGRDDTGKVTVARWGFAPRSFAPLALRSRMTGAGERCGEGSQGIRESERQIRPLTMRLSFSIHCTANVILERSEESRRAKEKAAMLGFCCYTTVKTTPPPESLRSAYASLEDDTGEGM